MTEDREDILRIDIGLRHRGETEAQDGCADRDDTPAATKSGPIISRYHSNLERDQL